MRCSPVLAAILALSSVSFDAFAATTICTIKENSIVKALSWDTLSLRAKVQLEIGNVVELDGRMTRTRRSNSGLVTVNLFFSDPDRLLADHLEFAVTKLDDRHTKVFGVSYETIDGIRVLTHNVVNRTVQCSTL